MRQQFEYSSILIPGLEEEDSENINADTMDILLKERVRTYNRLGIEGWELIAEHQDDTVYSVIATFRRLIEVQEGARPASLPPAAAIPAAAAAPTKQDPAYPTLQPDPTAPDAFRLVWER